jgi:hypothetical protein
MVINKQVSLIKTMSNMGAFRRERPASYPIDDGAKREIYQVKLNNTRGFSFSTPYFFLRMGQNHGLKTG